MTKKTLDEVMIHTVLDGRLTELNEYIVVDGDHYALVADGDGVFRWYGYPVSIVLYCPLTRDVKRIITWWEQEVLELLKLFDLERFVILPEDNQKYLGGK